jgi:hypothetical protein
MSNVFLNGFVKVGSKQYFDLVSHSAWQLHNSAAEGCATSVTTLIQSGILPISNYETGVAIESFGIPISNLDRNFVQSTQNSIEQALTSSERHFRNSLTNAYYEGDRFTQTAFKKSLASIIQKIID